MTHGKLLVAGAAIAFGAALAASAAQSQTRVTYKSAKSTSSYYQMAVQIAEAMKAGTGGKVSVTVEESQGSVQNVKEAAKRSGNYVFTTPPVLVRLAMGGKAMFKKDANPKYKNIRALFPIPSLTMHIVTRADAKVNSFADLAGKRIVLGKGSFGAREGAKYIKMFGIGDKVKLVNVELNAAVPALKNGQIDGFVTAGSFPAPNVLEAAAATKINVLSMSDDQIKKTKRTKLVIPAGTYPGVGRVVTTSLPVVAYTTTAMDDATAYELVKTYWAQKAKMAKANPWWGGVTSESLAVIGTKMHPGALKYYKEAGMTVPASAQ